MRRRDFMAGSAATAALGVAPWPVYAEINAGSPVPKRIALFHPNLSRDQWTSQERTKAYFQELGRLGYIEGKNLVAEWYSVLGRYDRIEEIASAIVGSRPDLIFSMSGALTRALKPLTTTIPILAINGDPVAGGFATNLAKPGGNYHGCEYRRRVANIREAIPVPCRDGAKAGKCAVPHDYNWPLVVGNNASRHAT
jgi:putative ABC transport system substrate-binding protein